MPLKDGDRGQDECNIFATDNDEKFAVSVYWRYCNEPDINYVGFEIEKVMIGFETCTHDMTEHEMQQIHDELYSLHQ